MSFNLCPLDPRIRKVLSDHPHLKGNFSACRIPIAERAIRHRNNFSLKKRDLADITLEDDLTQEIIFRFYRNSISLNLNDNSIAQAMLCHFLPIFKNTKCFIKIETYYNYSIRIIAKKGEQNLALLRLMLFNHSKTIYVADIQTYQGKGFGAKLLEATYCLAQDLGCSKIDFTVARDPIAQSFYMHMDFGKPNTRLAGKWELNVVPNDSNLKAQAQLVEL
jgi:GNAT superfamily N-acetyltransferase